MYDVAIVGAGPAGSTLARLIGRKYRVLLIEKRPLETTRESKTPAKCCGGLLAPDAQEMLARLGLALPQNILVGPQLFAVRTIDLHHCLERYYQRFYINIDRGKFDAWLLSLVPDNADVRNECVFQSFEQLNGSLKVNFRHHNKVYGEHAGILIGADGAASLVRRQACPRRSLPKQYLAIQEWYATDAAMPHFSAVFDPEITDFYSWTIPKENFLIIGAALDPSDEASSKFEILKKRLKGYGYEVGNSVRREGAYVLRPVKANQICTGKPGVALIGEAAGFISPTSAEGISYALRSAQIASRVLKDGTERFWQRYDRQTRRLKTNIFIKNLKAPFMYNGRLRKVIMASGINSIAVSID